MTSIDKNPKRWNYSVKTFREVGLEARWTRTRNGAPIIESRKPDGVWYVVDARLWQRIMRDGVVTGFHDGTLLGDVFHVPA